MGASKTVDHDARAERAAMNQMLFRDINERMKDLDSGFTVDVTVGGWICECANHACVERVRMSAEEYEAIRDHGARFFVAPSEEHVSPEIERVSEVNDRYWVVEKVGRAGAVAKRHDPRSDDGPLPVRT
jgi:hypothetical protein